MDSGPQICVWRWLSLSCLILWDCSLSFFGVSVDIKMSVLLLDTLQLVTAWNSAVIGVALWWKYLDSYWSSSFVLLIDATIFVTAVKTFSLLFFFCMIKFCENPLQLKQSRENHSLFNCESFFLCLSCFLCTSVSRPQSTYQAVVGGFRWWALFMCFGLGDSGVFHWKTLCVVP